jgi:hypothetical protein
MWTRLIVLMFAAGCVGAGNAADPPTATITENTVVHFHCLNHTSIHVVTCSGSISLFPITINIDSLRILSDNEIDVLDDALNDLTILDGDVLDDNQVLNDVASTVLNTFLNDYGMALSTGAVVVCTVTSGTQICK